MAQERRLLEELIKSWAQEHTDKFSVADPSPSDQGMLNTEGYLTWVIREGHANLDLLTLVNKLEVFIQNNKKRKSPDGTSCKKCGTFCDFAESNQKDGTFICYSCRHHP